MPRKSHKSNRSLARFMPFELYQLNTEFKDGHMNCKIFFYEINRLLELQRLTSNLFYSIIAE